MTGIETRVSPKEAITEEEAAFASPSVAERIALSDARVRANISYAVFAAFLAVNIGTVAGLYAVHLDDVANIRMKLATADQAVVNAHVLIALLGATTVQLGSMVVIMVRYLFPVPRP
jgi:hypothetical protein